MIEVKAVNKSYGKKTNRFEALKDISFQIPDKSTVAIVGKSGSGKSTLMHVMSGLDPATSGSVSINGSELKSMKPKAVDAFRATKMSFIFQSFFIEANQTCFQNIMLPLEVAKIHRSKRRKMVDEALEAVELSDKTSVKAATLSGGQKQRLAIARAIVHKPQLIFADEPTGNLDSATGEHIIKLLFGLNKSLGSTLIVVTHDKDLASRCQIQISLKDGMIDSVHHTNRKEVAYVS